MINSGFYICGTQVRASETVRGRRVALVGDAIETLKAEDGRKTIEELTSLGARLVTTKQALAVLERTTTHFA